MQALYSCNPNVANSAAPPIPLAAAWARRFPASPSRPLLNLAQGVPGSPPPRAVLDKLADYARDPDTTKYGPLEGDDGLRLALAADIRRNYGEGTQPVTMDDLVITAGCNLCVSSRSFPSLPRFHR